MEEQRAQRSDLQQMRTECELKVEELLSLFGRCAMNLDAEGIRRERERLHKVLRPLFDAKYGEVRELSYPLPKCEICGEVAEVGSAFCALCWQECPEAQGEREVCQVCGGSGFVAEPRTEGGQNARESSCERCGDSWRGLEDGRCK